MKKVREREGAKNNGDFSSWRKAFFKALSQVSPNDGEEKRLTHTVHSSSLVPSYLPPELENLTQEILAAYPTASAAIVSFKKQRKKVWSPQSSERANPYEYPIY